MKRQSAIILIAAAILVAFAGAPRAQTNNYNTLDTALYPTTYGTNGYCWTSNGASTAPTWQACASGGSGLTVGTTTITSGTSGRVLYDNAGVLGEATVSGTGSVVFTNTPTLVTPVLGAATGTSLALGGGTALTSTNQTGSGSLVLATSPTLVTPILGTPQSVNLANGTALPLTSGVSGILPTANGGTGIAYFTAAGPSVARVYTFPDAAATILYSGGALGTPSSGTLSSATGLPISTGVSGLGTGIATALAVNTGSAGAPVLFNGAGGTPTSIVLTNATGTAASLTAGTASAVAVGGITGMGTGVATWLATPSSANLASALTDETGSGAAVFATSPTLVTPVLGVATATTVNKVTISAPSSSATLTIANGKTLTANASITLAGTDSTTMTFPSTSATVARTDAANTFTGHQTIEGVTSTGATGTGALVFATTPTLVTPVLGVATATSVNGLAITTSTGTLTVTNGKTAAFSNTITFAGTDSTTMTFPSASATITRTVASGTSALGTSAISSGACATVVTTAATGTATTDVVNWGFNGDPTGVTGYAASANGMLTIIAYPSSGNVNYKVCNNTASSITPGAITLNWQVIR